MAHRVEIYAWDSASENGVDVIDVNYYCSNTCAQTDSHYAGWNGCAEIHDAPQVCKACQVRLEWFRYDVVTRSSKLVGITDEDWGKQ